MKNIDLTQGKVSSVLTKLSLPLIGSTLLQFTYNIVDMILVGGLGSDAVASVGSSSFFIGLGYSINSLIIVGAGIKVAHAIGAKNKKATEEYINASLVLNLLLALVYGAILVFSGKGLINFLQIRNPIVEKEAYNYLAIHGIILFFHFYNSLFTRILGSFGNNKLAFKINSIGVVINGILDPIFIYGLKLGVIGAALGTLIANLIVFILFLIKAKDIFKYNFEHGFKFSKAREELILGLPTAAQRVLFTFINIILARIIAQFGSDAIAAQKIGLQIESITFMIIGGGLNGAVASFTGQNYGAKENARILEGYTKSLKFGCLYATGTSLIFLLFNKPIIWLFIREPNTLAITSSYLKILAFSQVFSAIEMISNGLFSGLGKPYIPSAISITFTSLRIPMAILLTNYFGVNGVWMSISISSIFKGITAFLVYKIKIVEDLKN